MRSIVLLSGGLDSAATLGIATEESEVLAALTFLYGQRHSREVGAAKSLADHYGIRHIVFSLDLSSFRSAITRTDMEIPIHRNVERIPLTYVPARNLIFVSIAAGFAETLSADAIYIGANAVDFSGYPDCRPAFFQALQRVLSLGTKSGVNGHPPRIMTPVISMTKGEIIRRAHDLGVPLHLTWSCYMGGERPCGVCDACQIRLRGFREAGLEDPLDYGVRL